MLCIRLASYAQILHLEACCRSIAPLPPTSLDDDATSSRACWLGIWNYGWTMTERVSIKRHCLMPSWVFFLSLHIPLIRIIP